MSKFCQVFFLNSEDFEKRLKKRHPGESRGPELIEMTGFRLSPERRILLNF
jgi:hypothetical protein